MSKKMFSRERERGKLRFSALLILIGLLLFGCDPTMVTITYNANGGEGEMKPQAVESGVEVKLSANAFTKEGSDFTGWNEAIDGSGKAYADGATVAPTGNLTLYAQWQEKPAPENPGTEDPGTEDPESPVVLEDHITNLALIYVVEQTYPEFGWTKTAEGYVDMTNETNKTLVEGVTSLGDMSLDGIEYFTGLQELILENNSVLTELPDLTSLSNLRTLVVTFTTESTAVSSLTAVSGLPSSLVTLDLSENKLTELDVSQLTDLTYLNVSVNELTELDINKNTKLTYLACYANRMGALDITKVEAFSQSPTDPPTSILACGIQRNDNGTLTLTATQEQQDALASLFSPVSEDGDDPLDIFRLTNDGVVWDVPKAELGITAGTAVFNKTTGLTLSFGENQTLPEGAVASVSLGENEAASENVSVGETAITVALAALANDTVDMTVTVTVSAAGYNDAELTYSGVNTVWMPENVTAALADNEAKIGGESVSVTISQTEGSDDLSGIKISSGTYSVGQNAAETLAIGSDGRSFTAPILPPDAEDTGTAVTVSLVLAKANATDTVPVDGLTLTVYPSTHVRFDGKFYALAQGFDFTDENTLSDVKDGENAIDSVSEEGYVFSISPTVNEKKSLNFSLIDSDNIVLTMIEAKWDRNNCANIFVVGVDGQGRAAYGWSPFKGNYSFMLGEAASGADSGQRWNSKNDYVRLSVNPTENTFNKYFVFDDGGESNATLGFNDEVKLTTAAITSQDDITRISSISSNGAWPLTFQHANGDDTTNPVTYTLRAVNFYKAISQ